MNLTHSEILDLINASREHPSMSADSLFRTIVEQNNSELKYHAMINGMGEMVTAEPTTMRPPCEEILRVSCEIHNLFPDLMRKRSRKGELNRVRQQYCLVARLFKHTQMVVGKEILRDHTSVRNAEIKALNFYRSEEEYRDEVNMIINRFPAYISTIMERLLKLTKS